MVGGVWLMRSWRGCKGLRVRLKVARAGSLRGVKGVR